MMHAAVDRRLRAMYISWREPMLSDPNLRTWRNCARSTVLVVRTSGLSESAQLALIVVLPAAASLEKDGTVTNTERRVQLLAPIVPWRRQARTDWAIIGDLGTGRSTKLGRRARRALAVRHRPPR